MQNCILALGMKFPSASMVGGTKMKKYKYNQYTLRLNDTLNNFIKQEAKARGLSEPNYIRFMIVKLMEQKEDVQKAL